jgi:Tol biopolymer transport system component
LSIPFRITDDRSLKIYSVAIDGSASQQLSMDVPTGTKLAFNPKFDVSPDGQHIVYRLQSTSTFALISAPISGGSVVTLTPSLVEGGAITNYRFSMNGSHVLYVADQETNDRFALYAVPASGGSAVNLSGIQDTGASIDELYRTNGNDRVIYTRYINNKTDLFSVSISNGAPIQLTAATESAGLVTWTSPDNRKVVFFTQHDENGVSKYKLYAISPKVARQPY